MADINRFMVPAEIPQPSFFQLPYEQMKQGLLVAQQQQDQARTGLDAIGNVQFNYLTNPEDVKLANETYGYIDKGIEGIIAKQGNGDLRGLRNDIGTHAKNVSKLFRPDQVVGKLQSNYAAFNDWYKKQLDNKDLDPTYVNQAAETFMNAYDKKGGARAGSISTENLVPFFDSSKFVNDNKDMIKSELIQQERDRLGNNGYKYTNEDLWKRIDPEKIKQTMVRILMSNPDYNSSLSQRVRLGNLSKESIPLVDDKWNLNDYNPAASAIKGAMIGLGVMEEERHRYSIGNDEGYWKLWEQAQKQKEEAPGFPTSVEQVITYNEEGINKTRDAVNSGDKSAIIALGQQTQPLIQKAKEIFYDKNGNIKPEYEKEFGQFKDLSDNKKSIKSSDLIEAIAMSTKNDIFGHPTIDKKTVRVLLENKGYKVDYNMKDGKIKAIASTLGLYGDDVFDDRKLGQFIQGLNDGKTEKDGSPSWNSIGKLYLPAINNFNYELKSKGQVTETIPATAAGNNSKIFSEFQDIKSLGSISKSFNSYDPESGAYMGTLNEQMSGDEKNPIIGSNYYYKMDNVLTPGATGDSYVTLTYKDGSTKDVRIESRTSQGTQYLNQLINAHQNLALNYTQNLPNSGYAGAQAKNSNVFEAIRKLNTQDMNVNETAKNISQDMFTKIATLEPSTTRNLSTSYTGSDGNTYYGEFKSLPTTGKLGKYKIQIGTNIYNINNSTDLQQILTKGK